MTPAIAQASTAGKAWLLLCPQRRKPFTGAISARRERPRSKSSPAISSPSTGAERAVIEKHDIVAQKQLSNTISGIILEIQTNTRRASANTQSLNLNLVGRWSELGLGVERPIGWRRILLDLQNDPVSQRQTRAIHDIDLH